MEKPETTTGMVGLESRGWILLPSSSSAHERMHVREAWYIHKSLQNAGAQPPIDEQTFKRWRGLANVWMAKESLGVEYDARITQSLLPLQNIFVKPS